MDEELAKLRSILLSNERDAIQTILRRINDKDLRQRELTESLPDALQAAQQQSPRLSDALRIPIESALRRAIKQNPQSLVDLLFPIILPAIRRSVQEMISELLEKIDMVIDHSLSINALKWRWQAYSAGMPYREFVLRNTFEYWVEEAFLIERQSGLLLEHKARKGVSKLDEDAIASMLTAIQHFFADSFSRTGAEELEKLAFGSRSIYLLHGSRASLALLVHGAPTGGFRERERAILDEIHQLGSLRTLSEDPERGPILGEFLEQTLTEQIKPSRARRQRRKTIPALAIIALVAALYLSALWVTHHVEQRRIQNLVDAIKEETRWGVIDHSRKDDQWTLRLLHAPDPVLFDRLAAAHRVSRDRIRLISYLPSPDLTPVSDGN
ncbi:MAG: hypothetical protein ACFCUJ_12745 [Thiotrichales bacterium]